MIESQSLASTALRITRSVHRAASDAQTGPPADSRTRQVVRAATAHLSRRPACRSTPHPVPRRWWRFITGAAVAATALGLLSAAVASAGPAAYTEHGTFPLENEIAVFEPESSICGFPISMTESGTGRYQARFDADGEFVRAHVSGVSKGTLSANGIDITVRAARQAFYEPGSMTEVGLIFQYALPGTGVVLMDRGRLVWDVDPDTGEPVFPPTFEAGPHPFRYGDVGKLCRVLTP
jgi:hypothetical protein